MQQQQQLQQQAALRAGLPAEVLQRVANSIGLHADGNYEATQWLLQLQQEPQLQQLLQWLLHPLAVYPPLTVECKAFSALQQQQQQQLQEQQASAAAAAAAAEAYVRYDEAAKLVALQLLLEAVKKHWHSDWQQEQETALQSAVLQLIQLPQQQQHQHGFVLLPPAATAAAAAGPRFPAFSLLMKAAQCLAAMCCCSKTGAAAAQTTRQLLLQLASWAVGLPLDSLLQCAALNDPVSGPQQFAALLQQQQKQQQQLQPQQQQQALVAACVFLGVLLEIGLELNEESSSLMSLLSGKLRRQVSQALHKELSSRSTLLLQLSRFVLLLFSDQAAHNRLQPLALECIRCMAALGEVGAVLQCLCSWGLGGPEFQGAEGPLLQALDVVNERLVRKRQKKQAIDGVSVESVTAFCCLLMQSAAFAFALPVQDDFVDDELLSLQLLVASLLKNFVENCGDYILRQFEPRVLGALLCCGILRAALHPSLRVACQGVAAAAALLRKQAGSAAGDDPSQQQQQLLLLLPQWLDARALLSVIFVRCLRVGDPQLIRLLQPAAVADLDAVALQLLDPVMQSWAAAAAAAAAALAEQRQQVQQKLLTHQQQQQQQQQGEEAEDAEEKRKELLLQLQALDASLRALDALRPLPLPSARNWLRSVALYAETDDAAARDPIDNFSARFAGLKSSALLGLTTLVGLSPAAAEATTAWTEEICSQLLGSPLLLQRQAAPDSLMLRQLQAAAAGQTFEVADKHQPTLFPSCVLFDGCCCFVEAQVQRLKGACLTAAAAQQGGAAAAAAASGAWLLPQQAEGSAWLQRLSRIFRGLVGVPLFDAGGAAAAVSVAEHAKAAAAATRNAEAAAATLRSRGVSLHDYFLELRRLEFVSSTAHFFNYAGAADIKGVLDLLFSHILCSETSASQIDNIWAYPLPVPQQVHLLRRRSLQTLISLSASGAAALQQFLPLLLQHIQSKIHASNEQQLLRSERGLLIEAFVSLVSATGSYSLQQEHTIPLIEPLAAALRGLLLEVEQLKQQLLSRSGAADAAAALLPRTTGLIFYLFGDVRRPLQPQEEEEAAKRRRALARVLSSLETSIKRTSIPSDAGAARAGGYTLECSNTSSSSKAGFEGLVGPLTADDRELRTPFRQCLNELLQQQLQQKQLLPRRHPLATLVLNLLPAVFDFIQVLQLIWIDEASRSSFPHLQELLSPGADEFLAVQGTASTLVGDGSALSRAVLLAFPCSSSSSSSSWAGGNGGSDSSVGDREAAVLLTRRHCYHLRTLAYRLAGTCAVVADGFFLLPQLGDRLRDNLLLPLQQQLPLQHVEQQLRFFWSAVLDAETLPPQPPYPSQQLLLFFVNEGLLPLLQRLRSEWTAMVETKKVLESSSSSSSSSSKEEERRLSLYLQRVYTLSNVGDVLLQQIGSLLHHKSSSVAAAAVAAAGNSSSSGSGSALAKGNSSASVSRLNSKVAVAASPADGEEAVSCLRHDSGASVSTGGSSSSSSATELRLRVYYNSALLQPLVAAVLELQRWPVPSLIHQGHALLRAFGKTAAKLPAPAPSSVLDVCCLAISQLLSSYLDVAQFDPFAFGCASLQQQQLLQQQLLQQQQQLQQQQSSGGCTPLQNYVGGADAAGTGTSLLLDSTGSIYQLLKTLTKCLAIKTTGHEGGGQLKQQAAAAANDPRIVGALNFFRAPELSHPLSGEETELLLTSLLQSEAKEAKGQLKHFLLKNREALLEARLRNSKP